MKSEAKKIDGVAPSAYGSGGLAGRENTLRAQKDISASDPGPRNLPLNRQNPSSNLPPVTDHGTVPPIWYSFDLVHRRMQEGGWTHQVTERELPSSKEIAAVQMRITAGGYRELHWHVAGESLLQSKDPEHGPAQAGSFSSALRRIPDAAVRLRIP
jgi:oxalate decarboxylase